MTQKTPDIPRWASDQIEKGLIRDKYISKSNERERSLNSAELRTALMTLKLESLQDFFRGIAESKEDKPMTAYDISMYQTALVQLGQENVVIDGIYKDSKKDTSQTALLIENFQRTNGIKVDGLPGRNTARKIAGALGIKIASLPGANTLPAGTATLPRSIQKDIPDVPAVAPVPSVAVPPPIPQSLPTGLTPEDMSKFIGKGLPGKSAPGFWDGVKDRWNNKPPR